MAKTHLNIGVEILSFAGNGGRERTAAACSERRSKGGWPAGSL